MSDSELPGRPPAPFYNVDRQLAPVRRYFRNIGRVQTWGIIGGVVGGLMYMAHDNYMKVQSTVMPIYKRQLQQEGLFTRWQLPPEAGAKLPTKYI